MYASLKDVAAHAGVSFQTASKILCGARINVPTATRERVLKAARELDYIPNAVARGLVTQTTATIGIVADELGDWALTQLVVGAISEARARGHAVLISSLSPESTDGISSVRTLVERRVDGIISAAPRLEADRGVAQLLRSGVPAVGLHHVPGGGVPLVGWDNRHLGRLATEHLLGLGHRRIGIITGPLERHVVASRLHGYRAALEGAEVNIDASLEEAADWTAEGGFQATRRLLARVHDITAVLVHNDFMAMGSLSALHQAGRRVPEDVAVVGCDDLPLGAHTIPPLTTVRLPLQESGKYAVRLLLDHIARPRDEAVPERVLLPVQLIVRTSCGASQKL